MTKNHLDFDESNQESYYTEGKKWQLALEFSGIGMWEFDAVLHRVNFSEGSKKILGVTDPHFGENINAWNELVHPDDQEKYYQDFQDHLNGKVALYENEHRVKCVDGSYKWIRDRGKVVEWDSNNIPKRAIGTHTDITNQKLHETTINESLSVATEHNNKLRNFAHIVTHNLKQHTANFESLLSFYDEAESNEEKEELVDHLKMLSKSLTKTITNLQDVVNLQANKSSKVKKIYISREIDHILDLLEFVIIENNAIIHNNIDHRLFLYFNKSYFESIIQNLLSNAIKYKHPERDPIIYIDCFYDSEVFQLIISDNGLGIDLEKYGDDIFGLYKTFHHNDDAEGVGLYLIKNQIESFGGTITVKSKVNEGTTFTITARNKRA